MPLLIEFFSIPGGGKTTLASSLARRCGLKTRTDLSAAWNTQGPLSKLGHILGSYLDMRCNAAAVQFALRAKLGNADSIFRLARLLAKRKWVATQPDTLLFDQGFLQDLWSILYSAGQSRPDPRALSGLVARLYEGMQPRIIFLEVDPQCAARRIANRKHGDSRLDGLPQKELGERLVTGGAIVKALCLAAETAGLQVTRIDGSLPREVLVKRIALS